MSPTLAEVLKTALALSAEEKKGLINSLRDSMPDEGSEFDPEFLAEINRRSDELEAGTAKLFTWAEVEAVLEKDRLSDG
ncbi:MAG TPA: addiction module protein [Fimbriiglobus sp.]|jgi:putative addiction module component (TIGR02574 family)